MVYSLAAGLRVDGRPRVELDTIKGDGDIQAIEVLDDTPDGGLFFGYGRALVSGRPVKTEHVPKQLRARSKGIIADHDAHYGLRIVSPAFREIIERFEPGVHQFLPMQIVGANGAVLAEMFILVVCNRLDSVDREHTTLVLAKTGIWLPAREVPIEERPSDVALDGEARFVFSKSQIGTQHLWYDKHSIYGPYLSDDLTNALQSAGMTGMSLKHWEEV